jgi:UDP-N-acetyl-2-amino-2-deoxyglucuronate dehydrogenase
MKRNFALIGAGGYIAPRHMKAIKDLGHNLVAALDVSDSVGILDSFSHDVAFFTEFERFDRHAEKLKRQGGADRINYMSICSPNYLHDAHIRFALRIGADAICEKPLVLNPWNIDALAEMERETGKKIYNILQLRYIPSVINLKEKIESETIKVKHDVNITYITSRGKWFFSSWKGDIAKSGGIASNIGIHFFDMLLWVFGGIENLELHYSDDRRMSGYLELEKANVRWFLSVDKNDLPGVAVTHGKTTFRSINVDGAEFEFSDGFTDLHTAVYQDILSGGGFGLEDVRPSIDIVYQLRNLKPVEVETESLHPLCCKDFKLNNARMDDGAYL